MQRQLIIEGRVDSIKSGVSDKGTSWTRFRLVNTTFRGKYADIPDTQWWRCVTFNGAASSLSDGDVVSVTGEPRISLGVSTKGKPFVDKTLVIEKVTKINERGKASD